MFGVVVHKQSLVTTKDKGLVLDADFKEITFDENNKT
jgi:hypothetical protein